MGERCARMVPRRSPDFTCDLSLSLLMMSTFSITDLIAGPQDCVRQCAGGRYTSRFNPLKVDSAPWQVPQGQCEARGFALLTELPVTFRSTRPVSGPSRLAAVILPLVLAVPGCGRPADISSERIVARAVSPQFLHGLETFGALQIGEGPGHTTLTASIAPAGLIATFVIDPKDRYQLVVNGVARTGPVNLRTTLDDADPRWFAAPSGEFRQTVADSRQVEVVIYADSPFEYAVETVRLEPCPTCRTDADLNDQISTEIPGIRELAAREPLAAAGELLAWAAPRTTFALASALQIVPVEMPDKAAVDYQRFLSASAGVYCGGAAEFLMRVYRMFGIPAATIDFGVAGTDLTHVTVLVADPGGKHARFFVFDPTFNAVFRRGPTGDLVDLGTLLDLERRGAFSGVRFVEGSLLDRRWLRPADLNWQAEHPAVAARCEVVLSSHGQTEICRHPSFRLQHYSELFEADLRRHRLRADDALVVRLLRRGVFSIGQFEDQATREALIALFARSGISVPVR
jgi:hypothetical protein